MAATAVAAVGPSTRWRSLRAGRRRCRSSTPTFISSIPRVRRAHRTAGPPAPRQWPRIPKRYRRLAVPLGVVGAIKVEASPWIEDNLWVLEVAQRDPIIVGVIGNLEPDKPEFPQYLERYHKNPLFRGIRYGNLWGRDITKQSTNPDFIGGLKRLAEADLVLDTANPRVPLLEAMLRISDAVPTLRIVLDHLPALDPDGSRSSRLRCGAAGDRQAAADLREALRNHPPGERPGVNRAQLVSRTAGHTDGRVRRRPRPFGSDWPNSDGVAPVDKVFAVAKEYFQAKPRPVAEKYFWKNSVAAYKWVKRDPSQPMLTLEECEQIPLI